jgi:hypothetical protein
MILDPIFFGCRRLSVHLHRTAFGAVQVKSPVGATADLPLSVDQPQELVPLRFDHSAHALEYSPARGSQKYSFLKTNTFSSPSFPGSVIKYEEPPDVQGALMGEKYSFLFLAETASGRHQPTSTP